MDRQLVARIKAFAMTNQLIEADLDRIERDFSVDLGRRRISEPEGDTDYFPQFDEALRREAAEMAEHYEVFYALERSIRQVIEETFEDHAGTWWDDCVPEKIRAEVNKRIQKEIDSGITLRSNNPIDYTTFGELGEIIKSNWDRFGSIFNSPKAVEKVMANLNLLRNPIAHSTPLAGDEVLRLQLSLRDWFRLME